MTSDGLDERDRGLIVSLSALQILTIAPAWDRFWWGKRVPFTILTLG